MLFNQTVIDSVEKKRLFRSGEMIRGSQKHDESFNRASSSVYHVIDDPCRDAMGPDEHPTYPLTLDEGDDPSAIPSLLSVHWRDESDLNWVRIRTVMDS